MKNQSGWQQTRRPVCPSKHQRLSICLSLLSKPEAGARQRHPLPHVLSYQQTSLLVTSRKKHLLFSGRLLFAAQRGETRKEKEKLQELDGSPAGNSNKQPLGKDATKAPSLSAGEVWAWGCAPGKDPLSMLTPTQFCTHLLKDTGSNISTYLPFLQQLFWEEKWVTEPSGGNGFMVMDLAIGNLKVSQARIMQI